jgi:hypothetical protein
VTARIWLASYPKCGNTWMRLLLANIGQERPFGMNDIHKAGRGELIASSRHWIDNIALAPSAMLTPAEADRLRPIAYRFQLAEARHGLSFVKCHDAYVRLPDGTPLMGGREAARGAILIVRDPRDVAVSFANHQSATLDETIEMMNRSDAAIATPGAGMNNQLRQLLGTWSGFAASWLDQAELPVHLVRYEDMHQDPLGTLAGVLAFAGLEVAPTDMERAINFARFERLQNEEVRYGFQEAPKMRRSSVINSGRFFRRGQAGGWRDELTADQAARIEDDHRKMMQRLGYLA